MKTKTLIATFACLLFAGCEYDNYKEPDATLSGRVVYNGNPVGVRTNGVQLELWQDGYELYTKIPVYIAHDGTFAASLFNGRYKLVRLNGAPWENQPNDTIIVDVNGKTVKDISVTPYFIIHNETFQKNASTLTARFTVNKIVESESNTMTSVNLYFGKSILTDNIKYEETIIINLEDITLGQETAVSVNIPNSLANENYVFVRVGVKSALSSEYYFTQVQKINLK